MRQNTKFLLFLIMTIVGWQSCDTQANHGEQTGNPVFKTNAPNVLYFKNMRSLKYQMDRHPKTQLDYYRPKLFVENRDKPTVYPVIVHNWLQDEVYLILETNGLPANGKLVMVNETGKEEPMDCSDKSYESQLEVVENLADGMARQLKTMYVTPEKTMELTFSTKEMVRFTTTHRDFKNLTEK